MHHSDTTNFDFLKLIQITLDTAVQFVLNESIRLLLLINFSIGGINL